MNMFENDVYIIYIYRYINVAFHCVRTHSKTNEISHFVGLVGSANICTSYISKAYNRYTFTLYAVFYVDLSSAGEFQGCLPLKVLKVLRSNFCISQHTTLRTASAP